jgi:ABC-type dipeptide/oligopeptide/nickel transport system permease component
VTSAIAIRLPYTIELAVVATALGASAGIGLGVVSALYHRQPFDVAVSMISVSGMSMATYWLGLMLIIVFAVELHWLPASGAAAPLGIVLPSVTLATLSMGLVARMSRSAMLEVLSQDYLRTARAKGLTPTVVIVKHAVRNALLPIVTVIGLQFGTLLGGSVLAETVFSWPGMGRLLVDSIFARDYPAIQGCILVFSAGFILINVVVDVLYSVIDPRLARG